MSLRILSQPSLCKALLLHLVLWNLSETRTTSLSIGFLSCRVQKLLWLARMDYSVSLVHAPFKLLPQSSSLGNDLIRLYGGLLSYGSNLPRDLAASAFELLTLRKRMRLGSGKARTRTALEFMKDGRRAIIPDEDADFSPIWHKLEPKHRSTDEEALIVGRDLLSPRHFVSASLFLARGLGGDIHNPATASLNRDTMLYAISFKPSMSCMIDDEPYAIRRYLNISWVLAGDPQLLELEFVLSDSLLPLVTGQIAFVTC
ncbi:hypothetical protein C8R42DRAFT_638832 [Lentinula raphanica]|nr:hypothetical protein C8R42DRAFT_638832 [Lentinula raphanica]